ncbi:MAG: leucine--tRNA ligase [Myxococcales bacterium]|nr:leucine--tRNA ligase [Myxococcales bacterium]
MRYQPAQIEPKWQQVWDEQKTFKTSTDMAELKGKPKYYVLDMFPYPSGAGLHVGHPEGYTATDVLARYKRMLGFNVLHPMGWDAFGLPAERAAMRDNIHPAVITKTNVDNFRRQIKSLGFSYDWDREVSTTSADYYKWTQWIFLKLVEKDLAYMAEVPVNWCPALKTVLANEEVKDGVYVETGDPVEKRVMKQWMLKITAYADRLLHDLDDVDWPEGVKEMQRNWIGYSLGAKIQFEVENAQAQFGVFTTRADTLMGCTYCCLAPEHPLLKDITTPQQREAVDQYIQTAGQKDALQRTDLEKDKTGVFTGAYAIHPVTEKKVPIWVADYVLMSYGEGAVMAVPAHDERDHAFALKYDLPIVEVVSGGEKSVQEAAHTGNGTLVNSDFLNGLDVSAAKERMAAWLEEHSRGEKSHNYKLRDWLFSRQRYWGEPFPVIHFDDGSYETVPVDQLPVELPAVDEYKPTDDGRPPLARAGDEWLMVELPDGRKGMRETNTMPQWAGSCWYYLRYLDPTNSEEPWSKEAENYWMPVDLYVGGVEHAVLHLLYARFWHKVLYDCQREDGSRWVSTKEPFQKLFNQGMILAYSYRDARGKYYHPSEVEEKDGKWFVQASGEPVETQIEKMSKSRLNVVSPDEVIEQYGADAMRLYELFMGPLDQTKPWQTSGVDGVYRFLQRVWRLAIDEESGEVSQRVTDEAAASQADLNKLFHKTIKKVTVDLDNMRFNTAIAAMMTFLNEASAAERLPKPILMDFIRLVGPFAPHLAEELWARLGGEGLISLADWPQHDEQLCIDDTIKMVLQVNGKKRDEIDVPRDMPKGEIEQLALGNERVLKFTEGKEPRRVIVVPGRLVNVVV